MLCTHSEKPERERQGFEDEPFPTLLIPDRLLLDKRSLETSPTELRQALAYVLHLRSYWKPEGCAKLIVPALWMVSSVLI